MKKSLCALFFVTFVFASFSYGQFGPSPLQVVTTTTDLASLVKDVGGSRVEVISLAKGYENPHYVAPRPSFLLKLMDADLVIANGLDLESAWLPALISQSRNSKILSPEGYLDASEGAEIFEKRSGQFSRAEGDVHPFGNPHYMLYPKNVSLVADRIAKKMGELRPKDASFFEANVKNIQGELAWREKQWAKDLKVLKNLPIVTYHKTWSYFASYFALDVVGMIEPKPGIPPSPAHIFDLQKLMKAKDAKLIIIEPYFDQKLPESISRETKIPLVILPPSVGGVESVRNYFQLVEYNLSAIRKAIGK